MKVFYKNGITNARGAVLSYRDFHASLTEKQLRFNPEKVKRAVANAERLFEYDIPMLTASLYREFAVNGNRANFEAEYFLRRDMAVSFAIAEAYEGKGRFTEKLIDVVWAMMEESTWNIPAHLYTTPHGGDMTLSPVFGDNYLHGIDLFSASTAGALSVVYHLCHDIFDAVTPVISAKLKWTLHERGVKNFLQYEPWWTGVRGNRINNWCPWILSNVLLQTAIMEEDTIVREAVVTRSINYLDNFLNGYAPDGGCDEGPAYWGAAGASLFDCLELIEDMTGGKINVYGDELVRNIGDYIYKVNINGTRYVNFADCAPKTAPNPGMLIRFGEKTGSPFLVSFGKKQAANGDYFFSASHMYRSVKCLYSDTVQYEDCPMPLISFMPNLEVMTARQFSDSGKGMFLAAKGGSNDEMHNHNDVGNLMVYYNGEPVIIDTGVGQYTKQTFSSQRYELWFMQSGYHNLPSFDGIDQKDGKAYKSENVRHDESKSELSVELRSAYPKDAGIESYVRTSSLLDGVVTINEAVSLDKERLIDFHMMLRAEPVIEEDGRILLPEDRVLTYDTCLTASVEEFDPVGMNTKSSWGTDKLYRLHFTVNSQKCNVTFTIK